MLSNFPPKSSSLSSARESPLGTLCGAGPAGGRARVTVVLRAEG